MSESSKQLVPLRDESASADLIRHLETAMIEAPVDRSVGVFAATKTTAADQAILAGANALESGRTVIDVMTVYDSMRSTRMTTSDGYHTTTTIVSPSGSKLALGGALRSGQQVERVRDRKTGDVQFRSGRWSLTLAHATPPEEFPAFHRYRRATAVIPYIPPEAREKVDGDLSGKVVLWEQAWAEYAERERMSFDPALIEHVVGNLYIVHAVWELTPLEAAALGAS